ncbi:hypothetical protein HJG60_008160 [Phyllostomus discolor]|nr:hypothetical protein HJG60_008160 [Phyllostomus discolor]
MSTMPPLPGTRLLKEQLMETRSQHLGARNGLDKDGLCAGPRRAPDRGVGLNGCTPSRRSRWGVCLISVIPFYCLNCLSDPSLHTLASPRKVLRLPVRVSSEELLREDTGHGCVGLWLLESLLIKFLVTAKRHLKHAGFVSCECVTEVGVSLSVVSPL